MQNGKTSKPDMLDILFEHRNREYGAYAIRRSYPGYLFRALVAGVVLITSGAWWMARPATEIVAGPAKPKGDTTPVVIQPPPDIEVTPPPPAETHPATVPYTAPLIVPNDTPIKDTLAEQSELDHAEAGSHQEAGTEPTSHPNMPTAATATEPPAAPEKEIYETSEVDEPAEFPGGTAALGRFLQQRLQDPRDGQEDGDKVAVKVLFVVGKDGELQDFRILDGGEARFGDEVVRVLRKMPRWKPARQRNRPVAMHFILPVIFASNGD
jgi:protein TonB